MEEMSMNEGYAVVIEGSEGSYSAYSPDLPGCVSAGATREETERLMREAISLHIESLRSRGEPVPEPKTSAYVTVVAG
jgi:predicted RNase H-like HicB family nuclease